MGPIARNAQLCAQNLFTIPNSALVLQKYKWQSVHGYGLVTALPFQKHSLTFLKIVLKYVHRCPATENEDHSPAFYRQLPNFGKCFRSSCIPSERSTMALLCVCGEVKLPDVLLNIHEKSSQILPPHVRVRKQEHFASSITIEALESREICFDHYRWKTGSI